MKGSWCRVVSVMVLGSVGVAGRTAWGQVAECATVSTTETDVIVPNCNPVCPAKGACDCPLRRDLWDVQEGANLATDLKINVKMHIFDIAILDLPVGPRNALIQAQGDKIAFDFAKWDIVLAVTSEQFPGSPFAVMDTGGEVSDMKAAHAQLPDQQLNVYVTDLQPALPFLGQAVFPWAPDDRATGVQGGIILDGEAFGGDRTTLTHEIGHVLGLWHTHHGGSVPELQFGGHGTCGILPPCDCDCVERADGTDCDLTGDFCCDTPSTPVNNSCCNPGGQDCTGFNWGGTDTRNFMSLGNDGAGLPGCPVSDPPCRNRLSQQQGLRTHCWACDKLFGWLQDEVTGACGLSDWSCVQTAQSCCDNAGGVFGGSGSACEQKGACCLGDGACQPDAPPLSCSANGGGFLGAGTDCPETAIAACCILSSGDCVDTTQSCCDALVGGHRPNQLCSDPGFLCFWLPSAPSPGE